MTLLVDTGAWSLALRRDGTYDAKEVLALREALSGADSVVTTGLVLQELLQRFSGPKAKEAIIERFGALPLIQLCGRYQITLLSSDKDFANAARHVPFRLWGIA